jgi:hypothetical protein
MNELSQLLQVAMEYLGMIKFCSQEEYVDYVVAGHHTTITRKLNSSFIQQQHILNSMKSFFHDGLQVCQCS